MIFFGKFYDVLHGHKKNKTKKIILDLNFLIKIATKTTTLRKKTETKTWEKLVVYKVWFLYENIFCRSKFKQKNLLIV